MERIDLQGFKGGVEPLRGAGSPSATSRGLEMPGNLEEAKGSFGQLVEAALKGVTEQQTEAHQAIEHLSLGKDLDLHQVLISLEKADLSFRYLTQVRNKLVQAYQEIMRMQV